MNACVGEQCSGKPWGSGASKYQPFLTWILDLSQLQLDSGATDRTQFPPVAGEAAVGRLVAGGTAPHPAAVSAKQAGGVPARKEQLHRATHALLPNSR